MGVLEPYTDDEYSDDAQVPDTETDLVPYTSDFQSMTSKGDDALKDIGKLDMNMIQNDAVLLIVGARRTGKSTWLDHYMYCKQNAFDGVMVFSGTEEFNKFYSLRIPPNLIFYKFDKAKLIRFMNHAKLQTERAQAEGRPKPKFLLILDDVGYVIKKWGKDEDITWLMMNGRHIGISIALLLQYVRGFPKESRAQIDWVVAMRANYAPCEQILYDEFFRHCGSMKDFQRIFGAAGKDYGSLICNLSNNKSKKLKNLVFHCRPPLYRTDDNGNGRQNNFRLVPHLWAQYQARTIPRHIQAAPMYGVRAYDPKPKPKPKPHRRTHPTQSTRTRPRKPTPRTRRRK